MLAGCGASPPSLPVAPHAGQSPAQAARQHGCPTPGSPAFQPRRLWKPAAQRWRLSGQAGQHACSRDRALVRRSACQTAATLTAEPSTAGAAPAAAARGPDADRGNDARGSSSTSSISTRTEHPRLPQHDPDRTDRVDLVVAGGGPAGLAVAERVSAAGYKVRRVLTTCCRLRHRAESLHATQPALAAHRKCCLLSVSPRHARRPAE